MLLGPFEAPGPCLQRRGEKEREKEEENKNKIEFEVKGIWCLCLDRSFLFSPVIVF